MKLTGVEDEVGGEREDDLTLAVDLSGKRSHESSKEDHFESFSCEQKGKAVTS